MSEDGTLLVSVLVPIYNVEQYLGKTLDSIFTQTYQNVEYVFVNDCSPDNSLGVLKESINSQHIDESRYTIVCHEQNEGIAVSRADCLAHAKGDYVFFVDSDDWIESEAVEQMVKATRNGTIDIVGCDFMKDYPSGETTYHHENYGNSCRMNMLYCLNYDIATVLWKLLIRRSLFENFSITPHVDIVEDYIMSVKLYYYAKSFAALPHAFYHYVQYNQARVSLQTLRSVTMHVKGVKVIEEFCKEKGLYDKEVEHKLKLRKFNIRSNFLTTRLLDYDAYRHTFPESKGAWREMGYSWKERLKFWLADHCLFTILRVLQR